MRVERVRVFNIKGGGIHPVIVELTTADGMTSYGEAALAYGVGANAATGMLADMAPRVIGSDATHPRNLWHEIYDNSFWTKGGGAIVFAALSAIDQALWDIKAKALEVPVYELFGAKFSDSLEVYANGWNYEHNDAEEWARAAERPLSDGYKMLKSYPLATKQAGGTLVHVAQRALSSDEFNRAIKRVKLLREVVGDDIGLMFDLSGGLSSDQLIRFMDVCCEVNALWVEEPLDAYNFSGLRDMKGRWNVPIASGERIYTRNGFKNLLDTGAVDVAMPDVGNCGGIYEAVQIASMAEAYNVRISPHNCASSLCTAASIQVCAASANTMSLEIYPYFSDADDYVQVLKNPPEESIVDGKLKVTDEAGLGAVIDLPSIEKFLTFDSQQNL
jgi:galactonate dehydratase